MNKSLLLDELKRLNSFKKDKEFADFLGISAQNLRNWRTRNVFDVNLLANLFPNVNKDWLITGEGEMLKTNNPAAIDTPNIVSMPADVWEVIKNQAESLKMKDEQMNEVLASQKSKDEQMAEAIKQTSEVIKLLKEQLKKRQDAEEALPAVPVEVGK